MERPLISVVIPAFNEEHNIGYVLNSIHEVLKKTGFLYEIIVVDDGSVDRTAEVAKEHNVILVGNETNSGKGAALKAGFIKAKGQFIVTMDADGSHQPDDIPALIVPVLRNEVDVVVGSRFINRIGKNSTSRLHLIGNSIINIIILFLMGKNISDSQSGFRAFKRNVLNKLPVSSSHYEIESEMTIKMLKNGFKIKEIPIRCIQRRSGSTRIDSFPDGFKILKTIIKSTFCD